MNLLSRFYEVSVQGETGDLFSTRRGAIRYAMRSKTSNGVDISTYNFTMNAANIKLSQDAANDITSSGLIGAGTIVVPFIDHGLVHSGQPIYADTVAAGGLFDSDTHRVNSLVRGGDFKPAIKLRAVFDRVLGGGRALRIPRRSLSGSYFGSLYMTLADHMERYARNVFGGVPRGIISRLYTPVF